MRLIFRADSDEESSEGDGRDSANSDGEKDEGDGLEGVTLEEMEELEKDSLYSDEVEEKEDSDRGSDRSEWVDVNSGGVDDGEWLSSSTIPSLARDAGRMLLDGFRKL